MIMKRKKRAEAEKNMRENKKSGWQILLISFGTALFGVVGFCLLAFLKGFSEDILLADTIVLALGLFCHAFYANREFEVGRMDYDNADHAVRYYLSFLIGITIALICGFLPVGGWPFCFVFLMLALFSRAEVGTIGASMLLLISVFLSEASVGDFALYFISGIFVVTMFRHLENEFHIGIPLSLSLLILLVCETAEEIVTANARLDMEMFAIPAANLIVTGVLIVGFLKMFSSMVVFRYRIIYLDLCDTEGALLSDFRTERRTDYMHCVHTAYFCERIAKRLGLDADALKCAACYHKYGNGLEELLSQGKFPPLATSILKEYCVAKPKVETKEAAVLLCADTCISSIEYCIRKSEANVDYEKIIDSVFKRMMENGTFDNCEISLADLKTMQRIFKEEKLYYDFLH